MMTRKRTSALNPYCPVVGCRTRAPHANDSTVASFIKIFEDSVRLTAVARTGLAQLLLSMEQDWAGKRQFAWFCRIRQTEELFYKTLYAVFFAANLEFHHVISGERPNSFIPYYTKVNDELYAGRGQLTEELPGLPPDSVLNTTVEVLHSGAHTAFSALLTGYAFAVNKNLEPYADKLHWKVRTNVDRIDWVHRLLRNGMTKQQVLDKYKNNVSWRDELQKLKSLDAKPDSSPDR